MRTIKRQLFLLKKEIEILLYVGKYASMSVACCSQSEEGTCRDPTQAGRTQTAHRTAESDFLCEAAVLTTELPCAARSHKWAFTSTLTFSTCLKFGSQSQHGEASPAVLHNLTQEGSAFWQQWCSTHSIRFLLSFQTVWGEADYGQE